MVLSSHDVLQPDLLFVTRAHLAVVRDDRVEGAPDLAVELLSEGSRRRDTLLKRHVYERHGIPWSWIADPEEETVRILRLAPDGYGEAAVFRPRETLRCDFFPGIDEDVAAFFLPQG